MTKPEDRLRFGKVVVNGPCPVCSLGAELDNGHGDALLVRCQRCGTFGLSRTTLSTDLGNERNKKRISSWIFDRTAVGDLPLLSSTDFEILQAKAAPKTAERAFRLLGQASKIVENQVGDIFDPEEEKLMAASFSTDVGEAVELCSFLARRGLLEERKSGVFSLTAEGLIWLEENEPHPGSTDNGFVAMWFDTSMNAAFLDGFAPAISGAGYIPVRVDQIDHVGKIDDEIIRRIRQSRFVVADFTGHRGGVYYEAGFAAGLRLHVFMTCREDHMGDLHFDIRQYNCISWTDHGDLREKLQRRIEAVIGKGPH